MEGKIMVSEEQFFDTVDRWICFLTGEGRLAACGFCGAMSSAMCSDCAEACLVYELCRPEDSPYNRWCRSDRGSEEGRQAVLEILSGICEVGVMLGYYGEESVVYG